MLAASPRRIYHVQISHSRKASIDITIAGTVSPDSSHWNDQVSRGKAGADGAGSADADGGFHPMLHSSWIQISALVVPMPVETQPISVPDIGHGRSGTLGYISDRLPPPARRVPGQPAEESREAAHLWAYRRDGAECDIPRFGAGKFGFQMRHSINTPCSQCPL